MSHKAMIDGTAYEISGGKTLIDSTAYEIDKGKTLVDGTAYEVGFGAKMATITFEWDAEDSEVKVTIYATFAPLPDIMPDYTITDPSYTGKTSNPPLLKLPIGTVIECTVKDKTANNKYGYIKLNGVKVVTGAGTYSYTVKKNANIDVYGTKNSGYAYGRISITEE